MRAKCSSRYSSVIPVSELCIGFHFVAACSKRRVITAKKIPKFVYSHNSYLCQYYHYSFSQRLQQHSNCLWTTVRSQEFDLLAFRAEDQTKQTPLNPEWCAQSKQTHCVIASAVKLSFGGTVYFAAIRSQVRVQSSLHNSISHYKIKSAAACKCGRWIMRKG